MTQLDDNHLDDRLRQTFAQAAELAPRTLPLRTSPPATRRTRRSAARVLIATLVAAVIIPATFLTVRATHDRPTAPPPPSPMATFPLTSGVFFQAGVDGVLQVVDGCLVVTSRDDVATTTFRQFVLFPTPATSWHGDHIEYRGASFRIGDRVILGGGSIGLPPDAVIPTSCASLGKAFLDNAFSVGTVSAPSG